MSEFTALKEMTINKLIIGKYLGRIGYSVIEVLSQCLLGWTEETHDKS
jgi:hypothetical protein